MENLFERIMVLIFVLQALHSLYRRLFGGGEADEEPVVHQPLAALAPDAYTLMVSESIAQMHQAWDDIEKLEERIATLVSGARKGGKAVLVLRAYAETEMSARLNTLKQELNEAKGILETDGEVATAGYLNESQLISECFRTLSKLWSEVAVVEQYLIQRRTPETEQLIQIAEALAADLVKPIASLAAHRGLRTANTAIIGVLANHHSAEIPAHFLPGHQVIQVPASALSEPNAWIDVVRSTASGILQAYPKIARELYAVLGATDDPWLPRRQGRRVVLDVRAMFGAWRETIVTDILATIWIGPAYVQALKSRLESPDTPASVMDARTAPDGRRFADHPPAHLRVLLSCEALQTMGFSHASSEIRRDWFECHGESDGMWTETMWGQYLQVPWDQLFVIGSEFARHVIKAPIRSLGQTSLFEIEGMAMTPERWHTTEALLSDWVTGQASGGRPSTCLSALLWGELEYHTKRGSMMRRMRDAILTKKTKRKKRARPAKQVELLSRPITLLECTEALVLRTILNRRPNRGRSPQRQRLS